MSPAIRLKARIIDSENITDSQDFPLGESVFRIGRHPASNLVLTEATVSGRHAAIEFQQDQYVLIDQNSTNKTWLNGTELEPQKPYRLNNGDQISFDAYNFIFELEEIQPPPPKPAPVPVPDDDEDATLLMDDDAPADAEETVFRGNGPSRDAGDDDDETIFLDDTEAREVGAEAAAGRDESDDDETVFFDSEDMLAEAGESEPHDADSDDDETVFFDSEAMLAEVEGTADAVAEDDEDDDETVFLDDSDPVYDVQATFVRQGPAATAERTKIGNYYVSNLLGKGGFGSVWKGMTPDGEPVGLKYSTRMSSRTNGPCANSFMRPSFCLKWITPTSAGLSTFSPTRAITPSSWISSKAWS